MLLWKTIVDKDQIRCSEHAACRRTQSNSGQSRLEEWGPVHFGFVSTHHIAKLTGGGTRGGPQNVGLPIFGACFDRPRRRLIRRNLSSLHSQFSRKQRIFQVLPIGSSP